MFVISGLSLANVALHEIFAAIGRAIALVFESYLVYRSRRERRATAARA